jgi:hypothetical protein
LEKQKTTNSQGNTEQKEPSWRCPNFRLQTILQNHSSNTSWYWHKNIYEDQWNRIGDPDMNQCSYAHLIFDESGQSILMRKYSIFNKCCWKNWISPCKKLKLELCLSPCTSANSKDIQDFNLRTETLKLVQERAGNTLKLIGISNNFLYRTQMTH